MEDKFEKLGLLIDDIDNIVHALNLPLDPRIHVEQLKSILPSKVNEFKDVFTEITGENPWE